MHKYDAAVITGTYTDRNGNEKAQWVNVGRVIEKDGKLSLKLDVIPVGFDGWIKFFPPKDKIKAQPKQESIHDLNSDDPF